MSNDFDPAECVLGDTVGFCLETDCCHWSKVLEKCQWRQRKAQREIAEKEKMRIVRPTVYSGKRATVAPGRTFTTRKNNHTEVEDERSNHLFQSI